MSHLKIVRSYISTAKTALAIDYLTGINDEDISTQVTMLSSRFSTNERGNRLNIISPADYSSELSKINNSLLSIAKEAEGDKATEGKSSTNNQKLNREMATFTFNSDKPVLSTKAIFASLNASLTAGEIMPAEIIAVCKFFGDATGESIFSDIINSLEKANVTRVGSRIEAALESAMESLNGTEADLISFYGDKSKKNLETLFADLCLAPSEGTFQLFKDEATRVFASNAFYAPEVKEKLNALLIDEKPKMSGFGWTVKEPYTGWVTRVNTWLRMHFKA